ncbi:uncharacterized protein LOC142981173 [Anticarsia gemmatalis]|uniref:uncharacterized protein LOC142981173 n=1 Tax=Anticarsia gemmatalis TaxID=129554 RepID=UPI003F75F607
MLRFILVFCFCLAKVTAQLTADQWVTRAKLVDGVGYFTNVIQEFAYELERREWSSLKLSDINQNVDLLVADLAVKGSVNYTNGFLVSIQKLDVSNVGNSVGRRTEGGVVYPRGTVSGVLNFRNVNFGYDVLANLEGIGEQRYTGEILCNNADWMFVIEKDILSQNITVSANLRGTTGANIRMVYSPSNHITQVLGRNINCGSNGAGIRTWQETFVSILTDIVTTKIEFPRICINNC